MLLTIICSVLLSVVVMMALLFLIQSFLPTKLDSVLCIRTQYDNPVPKKAKAGDAGYDLYCSEDKTLLPNEAAMVSLGIDIKVPDGSVGLLMPRSSLNKIGVHCYPGTIDSGYTGPMFAMLRNHTHRPVEIKKGMRVCQLIPLPMFAVTDLMEEVMYMPETERGQTGFGSTGDAAAHV